MTGYLAAHPDTPGVTIPPMPRIVGTSGSDTGEHRVLASSISVVIPTIGRPALFEAVSSVLAQTAQVLEIIVAADTASILELPADDRIRIIRTGPGAGGNVARQRGIEMASGDVIALLDDDDVWLPKKIEQQLRLLNFQRPALAGTNWVLGCSVLATGADGPEVWPFRVIRAGEDVAEYIFVRHDLRRGHGFLQASGLVFPRELALRVPFRPQLRFHQDVTWLLDVTNRHPDLLLIQSQQPLLRYTVGSGSVSSTIRSAQSIGWAKEHLGHRSPRAMGDFLATLPVFYARREHSLGSAIGAVVASFRYGRPSRQASAYAASTLLVMLPEVVLHQLKLLVRRVFRIRSGDRHE
jgi:hypothetical protein